MGPYDDYCDRHDTVFNKEKGCEHCREERDDFTLDCYQDEQFET